MKLRCTLFALMAMLANVSLAQDLAVPPGWQFPVDELEAYELESFDHSQLLAEDTRIEEEGGRTNHGRLIAFDADMETHGQWEHLQNGDKIWRFRFNTANALGVAVYFDDYHIPVGASAYIYPADRSWVEGPYGSEENSSHGFMTTAEVPGGDAILEYYQPADVVGEGRLGIRGIAHFYRYVYFHQADERGGSDPCEVDVNCPEGDGWEPLRDSVVRLRIVDGAFVGLCSGSLVNTTAMDCRLYMLTALHCAEGVSDDDFLSLQCRFNYERSGCGTGPAPSSRNRTGVFHLADSNDGGGNSGSDFLLVELEDDVPSNWNPFFAGWDATGASSSEGVCIHHPAGDVKKISTYASNLTSVWWGAPGSHWEVNWVETETNHGVTEGGSSGSPIYNIHGQILGTLTGGLSFCTDPDESDYYGKMSYHWDNNPNPSSEKLEVWLDPEDTGTEVMFGGYAPDCDQDVLAVQEFRFDEVKLFPNPANDVVQIQVSHSQDVKRIDVYDAQGRMTRTISPGSNIIRMSVKDLNAGVYYLTFIDAMDQQVTKKLIVN